MVASETLEQAGDQLPFIEDFAETWRAASRIVYSTSIETVLARERGSSVTSTRLRFGDEGGSRQRYSVGGPSSRQAIQAGLVDEYQLFVAPVVIGGGTRSPRTAFGSTSNWWMSAASATHGVSELSFGTVSGAGHRPRRPLANASTRRTKRSTILESLGARVSATR